MAWALTHSAGPGEVDALGRALPHLAAEQAHAHTLEVLWGDLQDTAPVPHEPEVRAVKCWVGVALSVRVAVSESAL